MKMPFGSRAARFAGRTGSIPRLPGARSGAHFRAKDPGGPGAAIGLPGTGTPLFRGPVLLARSNKSSLGSWRAGTAFGNPSGMERSPCPISCCHGHQSPLKHVMPTVFHQAAQRSGSSGRGILGLYAGVPRVPVSTLARIVRNYAGRGLRGPEGDFSCMWMRGLGVPVAGSVDPKCLRGPE